MSTPRDERERIAKAKVYAGLAHFAAVNTTAAPAGYATTCPKCGGPANATIIKHQGQCVACMRAGWESRA